MRPVRLDIEKIATMQFRGRMGDRSIGRDSFCKVNGVLFAFWAARLGRSTAHTFEQIAEIVSPSRSGCNRPGRFVGRHFR
jgi:hypothetical protein